MAVAFGPDGLDDALRLVALAVGGDAQDGPLPDERWVWIHRITVFNDAPTTSWPDVEAALGMALAVSRREP